MSTKTNVTSPELQFLCVWSLKLSWQKINNTISSSKFSAYPWRIKGELSCVSSATCSRPVPLVQWVTFNQTCSMQTISNNVVASPSHGQPYGTHQPSHHTRTLRLLFSGLQAAAPGVITASFPAAVPPWCWW